MSQYMEIKQNQVVQKLLIWQDECLHIEYISCNLNTEQKPYLPHQKHSTDLNGLQFLNNCSQPPSGYLYITYIQCKIYTYRLAIYPSVYNAVTLYIQQFMMEVSPIHHNHKYKHVTWAILVLNVQNTWVVHVCTMYVYMYKLLYVYINVCNFSRFLVQHENQPADYDKLYTHYMGINFQYLSWLKYYGRPRKPPTRVIFTSTQVFYWHP